MLARGDLAGSKQRDNLCSVHGTRQTAWILSVVDHGELRRTRSDDTGRRSLGIEHLIDDIRRAMHRLHQIGIDEHDIARKPGSLRNRLRVERCLQAIGCNLPRVRIEHNVIDALQMFDRSVLAQIEYSGVGPRATAAGDNDGLCEVGDVRVAIQVGARGRYVQRFAMRQTVHVHVGEKAERTRTGVELSTQRRALHVAIAELNLLVGRRNAELAHVDQAAGTHMNHGCALWFHLGGCWII